MLQQTIVGFEETMGLFNTVVDADATKKSELPTVIELCAKTPLVGNGTMPSFAPIHYSAIQTDAIESKVAGLRSVKQDIIPDLGVWSVPCHEKMVDALIPKDPNVFCLSIDLTKIPFSEVEPYVNLQQQALIRHLIQHPREKRNEIASTSLDLLKTSQFGLAPDDTTAESKPQEESPEDKTNVVALQICLKLPPRSEDVTEQQKLSYVVYHFHKFALSTKASLVFVSEEEPQETLGTVYPNDLSAVWKGLAQDKAVWEMTNFHEDTPKPEEEKGDSILVYGPDSQAELLDSIWQRNASAPGKWNAAKDSMWTVFPPESKAANPAATPKILPGDEGWLAELRDSMANVTAATVQTPPRGSTQAQNETSDDKDLSSFFKDLMNN